MSKIVDKYIDLKKENPNKIYMFKSGKFYIFIGDDCDYINNYAVLKKVPFSKDYYKCGFPENALENYLRVFNNCNINYEIIDDIDDNKDVIYFLNKIDINNITPIEALNKLKELKDLIENK